MKKNISNKTILTILMFNMFINMAGLGLIVPIMPAYLAQFNAAGQVLGLLIAIFAFAQFVFSPIVGGLSDKYGRKNLIIIGLLIFAFGQLCFSLSTQIWMLFASRFFIGLGSAFIGPPIMAFVADITPYEERGKGMALLGAAMSLGFMIGPGIGGFLAQVSLVFPFYFSAIVALLAAIVSMFMLPNIKPIIQNPELKERLIHQFVQSVKTPYFVILLIMLVFSFGVANFQVTMSLFVTQKFGYTSTDIAIILTLGGAIGVLVQMYAITPLFNLYGEMKIILVNLIIASLSMITLIFVEGFATILLVATVFSTATTLIRPAVNTLISKLAGNNQGFAAGMNNAYMSLGNMIGPALAGILFDINRNIPYYLGAIILFICFFMTLLWTQKKAPHLMQAEATTTS